MRPGPDEDDADLFDSFAHRVEEPDGRRRRLPPLGALARSAGVTVALMVLTCFGVVGGAWLGGSHAPDVEYTSVLWEGVVLLLWGAGWALLGGAVALAVGFVVVALPWVRRRRSRS